MKTKTNKLHMMIVLFAALTVTMVLSIAAGPAMAGTPHLDRSKVLEILDTADHDRLSQVMETVFPFDLIPGTAEAAVPDEGPFPDGGGWEPVFPEDDTDDAGPADEAEDAGDEAVEEDVDEAAEERGDETCEEEIAEAGDEAADEMVEEEAVDEPVAQEEDEASELPFTGGDSTPWLIAGAAIILAGIIVLLGRRGRHESR